MAPKVYVLYGDLAYSLCPLLMKPYIGGTVTPQQATFNKAPSIVRQAVERSFGKIVADIVFLDLKKN